MQMGKYMAQILKFVYVIIIFLSSFSVAMNNNGYYECTTDQCRA
ncbi:putative Late nodulin [Medicago truncatula]|uniref:Nodule Cysteine-Rich (NCR) secreted peptide n=1 Tax=Medicago truncatula TaxID=3880 RepID=A0A072UY86_MEDTR|nr:Nodule Cysteine-Rich (NCR) secreted peptide [Medicago truncatula]RHN67993.1 putative Late nodulin [Medicago truncatula]